jgi:pimeloyl-ACP methyl ester carboxylesterase
MGNALSIEPQVLPGCPNPRAKSRLESNNFVVGDFFAMRRRRAPAAPHQRPLVVFHGNMEETSATVLPWERLHATCLVGFEYPGYGWRGAEPATQAGILADVPRQVKLLKDEGRVIIIGRSLGTFAALNLAVALGRHRCAGVVLISPMLTAIATKVRPPLHRALAFMDFLDNESTAKLLDPALPVLIIHGSADLVVPATNAQALCRAIPKATYIELHGVHHNDVMLDDAAWQAILDFREQWATQET